MKHGKKYVDAAKLVDKSKLYEPGEALETVIKTSTAKFDETVELHVKLGVDSRHADQQVRGAVVLPNGTGKDVRVLAICKGANEELAKEAGADFVGAEDMTQKIQQENWMDFDVLITTPDCMGLVGRLGRILGPRPGRDHLRKAEHPLHQHRQHPARCCQGRHRDGPEGKELHGRWRSGAR